MDSTCWIALSPSQHHWREAKARSATRRLKWSGGMDPVGCRCPSSSPATSRRGRHRGIFAAIPSNSTAATATSTSASTSTTATSTALTVASAVLPTACRAPSTTIQPSVATASSLLHAAGTNGSLSEGYPEVREYWLSWVKECMAAGVDGLDVRISNHSLLDQQPRAIRL